MMNTASNEYVTRDKILSLLTDEETAKVSNKEAAANLIAGDEYLDLARLDQGIQQANATASVSTNDIIPRGAVSAATWTKINAAISGH
jgi:hypothetical protein